MSESTPSYEPGTLDSGYTDRGTADVVREQAAHVADTAVDEGQRVVEVAKEEAAGVAYEAKAQAKDLYRQAQDELREQAAEQQKRVASGLQSISDELFQMAGASERQGVASDIARQAADRAGGIASWLDRRDPGSLLAEIKSYARRNPGTFIAGAAIAGLAVGRLTRSLASGSPSSSTEPASVRSEPTVYDVPASQTAMRTPPPRVAPVDSAYTAGMTDPLGDLDYDRQVGERP
jgi:hypothetical protein